MKIQFNKLGSLLLRILNNKPFLIGIFVGLTTASMMLLKYLSIIKFSEAEKIFWYSGSWAWWSLLVGWTELMTGLQIPRLIFDVALLALLPLTYGFLFLYGSKNLFRAIIVICLAYLNYQFVFISFRAMN